MRSHRTTARAATLLLVLGLAAGVAAARPPDDQKPRKGKRIVFPIVGQVQYTNDFGDPRWQGRHEGIDIMAPRKALAVAAEAGTVKFWNHSSSAGCMIYLYGKSGTVYYYIHLNNDRTMRNDNRGKCAPGGSYARKLRSGDKVKAGEMIGYVGNSGDADGIHPHLHFEVHPHGGSARNPYRYLNRGKRLLFTVLSGQRKIHVALGGKVVSKTSTSVTMYVKGLKAWPGRFRVPNVNRRVTIEVPEDATILRRVGQRGSAAHATTLATARKGEQVGIRTLPQERTLGALLGKTGTLDATRVLLTGIR